MDVQTSALLEALSDAGLARQWDAAALARGAALVKAVHQFEATSDGALSAAQARVQGGALYRVHLTHSPGRALRGDCDCPHAAGGAACKHQAAVALLWRQRLGGAALAAEPAPPPAPKAEPDWARFVRAQPAEELAARLLSWAARVPELRRELQTWQQSATPVEDLAQAKMVLTTLLTPPRDLHEWRKVSTYVRKAESVLGLLAGWAAREPALGLGAAEHALQKLIKLLDSADDSHGEIQDLIRQVAACWCGALERAGPQPAAFAERYLKLLALDAWGFLPVMQAQVAMGEAARSKVRATLRQRCDAELTSREEGRARRDYLDHLQSPEDLDERLRVLRARLHSWTDHQDLIQTLESAGRAREALAAAEAGHKAHPDAPRLTELLIRAYQRDGWDEEALRLRREDFDRQPDGPRYHALLEAVRAAGADVQAERSRIWHALQQRVAEARGWQGQQLGALMLDLWTDEGDWAAALDWLRSPRDVGPTALDRLARSLPPEHAAAAGQIYKSLLEREMPRAKSPYTAELRLVRAGLERLGPEAGRLWLAWLRLEYRAKRHFIEGLVGL